MKVRVFMNGTLAPYGELRLEVGKGRKALKEAVAKEWSCTHGHVCVITF